MSDIIIEQVGYTVEITTGAPGITWRGVYSDSVQYMPRDAVQYQGSSYICIESSIGHIPTDIIFWNLLTSKGDTGAQGPKGDTGAQGPKGDTGAQGNPGASGTIDGTTITSFNGILVGNGTSISTLSYTPEDASKKNQANGYAGLDENSLLQVSKLPASGVTPGSYSSANITVDSYGRITFAANGSGGSVFGNYLGTYALLSDLQTAHPTPQQGDFAFIRVSPNFNSVFHAGYLFNNGAWQEKISPNVIGGYAIRVGTDVPDMLSALKIVDQVSITDRAAIDIVLPAGITQLPNPTNSEGMNTGFGYNLNRRYLTITGAYSSVNVSNVSVAGSLGQAVLTFAAALPSYLTVGMSVHFYVGNSGGWTQEGLSGAFEITAINGLQVTIATPGITLPNDAGGVNKRVRFIQSTLLVNTENGSNGFLVYSETTRFSNLAVRCDAAGRLVDNQSVVIYVTDKGKVQLVNAHIQNGYTGILASQGGVIENTGSISSSFTGCAYGISCQLNSRVDGVSATSGRLQFTGNDVAIYASANSDVKLYTPQINLSLQQAIVCWTKANVQIIDDAQISSASVLHSFQGGRIYGITKGTANIPLNQTQSNGSFIGVVEGGNWSIVSADKALTFDSQKIMTNSLTTIRLSLPAPSAAYAKIEVKNGNIGTVIVSGTSIDGKPDVVIPGFQSVTIESVNFSWIITESTLKSVIPIYTSTAIKEISNTTTRMSQLSVSKIGDNIIRGNVLQVGDTIEVRTAVRLSALNSQVTTFDVSIGSYTISSTGTLPNGLTLSEADSWFALRVLGIGVNGSLQFEGRTLLNGGSGVSNPSMRSFPYQAPITIDTTQDFSIDLFYQWANASASNSLLVEQSSIRIHKAS